MKILFKLLALLILIWMHGCDTQNAPAADDNGTEVKEPADDNETVIIDPVQNVSAQWYMKTVVSAIAPDNTVYTHDKAGVFGALEESSDGYDSNDVPGLGTAILQVVFPKPQWDVNSGDYASDYHGVKDEGEKEVWTFQIKNQRDVNLANAPINLVLEGPYDITSTENDGRMKYEEILSNNTDRKTSIKLVDVDNAKVYTYAELQSATLSMDGLHTRTFRWVLGEVDADDYLPLETAAVTASYKSMSVTSASNSKFGLPPQ